MSEEKKEKVTCYRLYITRIEKESGYCFTDKYECLESLEEAVSFIESAFRTRFGVKEISLTPYEREPIRKFPAKLCWDD